MRRCGRQWHTRWSRTTAPICGQHIDPVALVGRMALSGEIISEQAIDEEALERQQHPRTKHALTVESGEAASEEDRTHQYDTHSVEGTHITAEAGY